METIHGGVVYATHIHCIRSTYLKKNRWVSLIGHDIYFEIMEKKNETWKRKVVLYWCRMRNKNKGVFVCVYACVSVKKRALIKWITSRERKSEWMGVSVCIVVYVYNFYFCCEHSI